MADILNVNNEQETILESSTGLTINVGISDSIKVALLNCFDHVAWADDQGQTYYDALYDALYPTKTLMSISAVYTQGGTVYDIDTLDDLKADLVVTGHYDDFTTEAITTYTLSGSLTAGTSTITVIYLGKTTTFDVTVTAIVPDTYTRHDYIYTTADGTSNYYLYQVIHTKTYDNLNVIGVEFEYESAVSSTGDAIFGGRTASGYASSFAFYSGTTRMPYHLHGVDTGVTISQSLNERHTVVFTQTSLTPSTITFDGTDYSIAWSNNNTINTCLNLFVNRVSTNTSGKDALKPNIKLGTLIVRDISGNVINRYFPVERVADHVIGLYDSVEDTFYTCSTVEYSTIGNANCLYGLGDWE